MSFHGYLKDGYSWRRMRPKGPWSVTLEGYYRSMTRKEVMTLDGTLGSVTFLSNDGTVRMCRLNGKIKTWKRDANRIEVPVKYGLQECYRFDENEIYRLLVRIPPPTGEVVGDA